MTFLVMLSVATRLQTAIHLTVSWTWAFLDPPELLQMGSWLLESQLTLSSKAFMAVPFCVKITVWSNKVAFPESDMFKQSRGLIGASFSIATILQGFNSPFEPQSACITVSVILQ